MILQVVIFTQNQFAELLTNMNSAAVPCTISYREALGHIEFAEMPQELQYIKDEIQHKKDIQKDKLRSLQVEAYELLTKTGTSKESCKAGLQRPT